MPKNSLNVSLKGADDIFSTEESRQEQQREQVQQIPIGELFPFKNHPFKVLDDEAMTRTVESIAQYGVLAPLIAHPLALLLMINLFLFIMGMIMDLTPNILIFGPILIPVIEAAGIDPIVFGVIMVLNLTIGLITPPVGTILYIGCSIADLSFGRVVKGVLPFLACEIIVLLLFSVFPQLISVPMGWLT